MNWDEMNNNLGWLNDNFTQYLPSGQLQRIMGHIHLAMPYSDGAVQDATAVVPADQPLNHSLNWLESHVLGITPSMKAADLQKDRAAFYRTPEGKAFQRQANLAGFNTQTKAGAQKNIKDVKGQLSSVFDNIAELEDQKVTYRQLEMANAGQVKDAEGNLRDVSVGEIQQRAAAFKNLKSLRAQIAAEGAVPKDTKDLAVLNKQLREAKANNLRSTAKLEDEITYGTVNPDGTRNNDGTEAGRQQIETHQSNIDANNESIEASKSTRRVNEGNLAINQTVARNNVEQSRADNDWRRYVYDDSKAEAAIQRQYEAGREDARYDARAKEIQMQNDADMKRYQLMLENDREVRRSEDLGDLFGALAMLGGAFMI